MPPDYQTVRKMCTRNVNSSLNLVNLPTRSLRASVPNFLKMGARMFFVSLAI